MPSHSMIYLHLPLSYVCYLIHFNSMHFNLVFTIMSDSHYSFSDIPVFAILLFFIPSFTENHIFSAIFFGISFSAFLLLVIFFSFHLTENTFMPTAFLKYKDIR